MLEPLNPHHKTRGDHASETSEDYAEAILRLAGRGTDHSCECAPKAKTADIARHFQVAQPTVTKILHRLEAEGLVCVHRRKYVHLTQGGHDLASHSLRRHQTVVKFLVRLGVGEAQAQLDTEGMEHHISDESLDAFERFLLRGDQR
jgi:DtxR family manganese transport transcriptional regulator